MMLMERAERESGRSIDQERRESGQVALSQLQQENVRLMAEKRQAEMKYKDIKGGIQKMKQQYEDRL